MSAVRVNYVQSGVDSLCTGRNGEALIPVRSRSMLRQMARAAALHGVSLTRAEAAVIHQDGGDSGQRPSGLVVATAASFMPPARVYAHLTGRYCDYAEVGQPLPKACEVVMLGADQWTSAAADWLEEEAEARPDGLGILIAPDAEGMLGIAACRAIGLAARPASVPRAVTLLAMEAPASRLSSPTIEMFGAQAEPDMLRRALAQNNDLLFLHAHADGFDAKLGSHAVLCAFPFSTAPQSASKRAACLVRDVCHRLDDMPRGSAWNTGRLIGPHIIQARILVLETCSGMPVVNAHSEVTSSLGGAILRTANFGALIASVEVHLSTSQARAELMSAMQTATNVGSALRKINTSAHARETGRTLFLFGDPRYGGANTIPAVLNATA